MIQLLAFLHVRGLGLPMKTIAVLLMLVTFAGCMPLKQTHVTGAQQHDHFLYLERPPCGLVQFGPSNVAKDFVIVDAESYAIAPNGVRYGIVTEPHDYDVESPDPAVPYVRDRVYLVDARGRRIRRAWDDGEWKLHFVLEKPAGREHREFEVQLGTFNYNPVLHGPPN